MPPTLCKLLHSILTTTSGGWGRVGFVIVLFYRGRDCSPRKVWSKGAKSHSQEGPSQDQPTLVGQGGVRAGQGEEEELGGLAGLSARVLWNGLGGPSDPQGI